jgi:hypothetical protein
MLVGIWRSGYSTMMTETAAGQHMVDRGAGMATDRRGDSGSGGFVSWVDRYQQSHASLAFPFAVFRKFGDDQAGNLAALIAYYAFFSVFPLLLTWPRYWDTSWVVTRRWSGECSPPRSVSFRSLVSTMRPSR